LLVVILVVAKLIEMQQTKKIKLKIKFNANYFFPTPSTF
jgi:hypothetical protein